MWRLSSSLFPYTTLFRSCFYALLPLHPLFLVLELQFFLFGGRIGEHRLFYFYQKRKIVARSLSFHSPPRSEEHTSELQSRGHILCCLLLYKKSLLIKHVN